MTVMETCTCGGELTVIGKMRDNTPVTRCAHCDIPLAHQPDHPMSINACGQCYRYDHHASRIFPRLA